MSSKSQEEQIAVIDTVIFSCCIRSAVQVKMITVRATVYLVYWLHKIYVRFKSIHYLNLPLEITRMFVKEKSYLVKIAHLSLTS